MDIFSEILEIQNFKIVNIEVNETEIHIYLENELSSGLCPRCSQESSELHQNHERIIRDLSISGKVCYLHFSQRRFYCSNCGSPFYEKIDFVEPNRGYTKRYEKHIFHLVRQTNVSFVAELEGLTDNVVKRIFIRQAKKILPEEPFKNVIRLGIDEIALPQR